jgi:hypothetical protein
VLDRRQYNADRATKSIRATAMPAWRSVLVSASLPTALSFCTLSHSVGEFRRLVQSFGCWGNTLRTRLGDRTNPNRKF